MADPENAGDPGETFDLFVKAINDHDIERLSAYLSPDHVFVDSVGNRVSGAASMREGWRAYLTMCPDYWIHVERATAEGDTVLAVGEAGGTIDGTSWRTPAAWLAVIRGGMVVEWRVFADNKPVYEILTRRQNRPAPR